MKFRELVPALVISLAILTTGCTGQSTSTATRSARIRTVTKTSSPERNLTWGACENKLARTANLECAHLEVPLDPSRPKDDTIDLVLARQRATGQPAQRIGSLVLNPGGPGGSGVEFLAGAAVTFPDALKERFDLVSFDPRGVGESSPVRCLTDSQKTEQLSGDLTPGSPSEIDAALEDQQQVLKGCEKNAPKLLSHMSTADVAADLDRIREALGDDKLTYTGFSYGTAIGAVYATLFPERTRALVLDGSVDPNGSLSTDTVTQALGFEHALSEFETACNASSACALAPDAHTAINKARTALERAPLKVESSSGKRTFGVDQFDLALAMGLYDTSLWGPLAEAISDLKGSGAAILFSLVDHLTGRNEDGSFNNSSDAQTIVNCSDMTDRPDRTKAVELAEQVVAIAPTFGPVLGWSSLSCIGWPKPANPVPRISGTGSAPVLVVGTMGDPATPYAWAQAMASQLESATLLTYEGNGHTAFTKAGPCIDDAVVGYLVDLRMPAPGTVCPANDAAVSFAGLTTQIVSTMVDAGLPEDIAQCIVNAAIADLGEEKFNRMVLSQDSEGLQQVIMAKTLSCVQMKKPR